MISQEKPYFWYPVQNWQLRLNWKHIPTYGSPWRESKTDQNNFLWPNSFTRDSNVHRTTESIFVDAACVTWLNINKIMSVYMFSTNFVMTRGRGGRGGGGEVHGKFQSSTPIIVALSLRLCYHFPINVPFPNSCLGSQMRWPGTSVYLYL